MTGPYPDGIAAGGTYLRVVGDRLRLGRAQRGMTRRLLAARSGVSERTIAQVEGGTGNISILLLHRLAHALGVDVGTMVTERAERAVDLMLLEQTLARLPPSDLVQARQMLAERFSLGAVPSRRDRVALVGLRGAGKSSLGRALAERRGIPFVELDREIEQHAGLDLAEIFELHGQAGFRRMERDALDRLIARDTPLVIATGGSLVTEPGTYEALLSHCLTVWIRATPDEHMRRVIAQGDLRPMSENRRAMEDLRAILHSREALYAKADRHLDTSGHTMEASAEALLGLVG